MGEYVMGSNMIAMSGPTTEIDRNPKPIAAQARDSRPIPHRVTAIKSVKELDKAKATGDLVPISDEQLIRAIDRAIAGMQGVATSLDFSVHKSTKQIMVKVLNSETGEIIREIPPERTLDFLAKVWEKAGILVDERR